MSQVESAGVLLKCQGKYLVGTASNAPDSLKGWGIPKGKLEKNEKHYDAAFREFQEETGFDLSVVPRITHLEPFHEFSFKLKKNVRKNVTVYLTEVKDLDLLKHVFVCPLNAEGIRELHNFRWVTAEEGYELVTKSQKTIFEKLKNEESKNKST